MSRDNKRLARKQWNRNQSNTPSEQRREHAKKPKPTKFKLRTADDDERADTNGNDLDTRFR
jgi:hypothetical protein